MKTNNYTCTLHRKEYINYTVTTFGPYGYKGHGDSDLNRAMVFEAIAD